MDLAKKLLVTELLIKKASTLFAFRNINILWSGGKDSTVLLHIIKNMFGVIPFSVVFADSLNEFNEIYALVEQLEHEWRLPLIRVTYPFKMKSRRDRDLFRVKINRHHNFKLTISGIRWYEHFHQENRFFSKGFGTEIVYPLLHWTSKDIWMYIKKNTVPYVDLYKRGYLHLESRRLSVKQAKKPILI